MKAHKCYQMSRCATIVLVVMLLFACSTEPVSYHWNEVYGYGTSYPSLLGKKHFAQNGKGFSVKNTECELWADLFYDRVDEDGNLLVANDFLHGCLGPKTIIDTTYNEGSYTVMDRVVAYDMQFLEIWCKYPTSEQQKIGQLFRLCFDRFPQLDNN